MPKKIDPQALDFWTNYYVALKTFDGILFGVLNKGRLFSLRTHNKLADVKTYENVMVAFKTVEGLMNWRTKHFPETVLPDPYEADRVKELVERFDLQVKSINKKIRIEHGFIYFEPTPKHKEPVPYTSVLYQQMKEKGAALRYKNGFFALYADKSCKEELASGYEFVSLLFMLADREYRKGLQQAHQASLNPDLIYISKGDPEKKQPPFILSQVV